LTYFSALVFGSGSRLHAWEVAANLLMLQVRHMRPIEGVYWTLHQEMYFYLVMLALLGIRDVAASARVSGGSGRLVIETAARSRAMHPLSFRRL